MSIAPLDRCSSLEDDSKPSSQPIEELCMGLKKSVCGSWRESLWRREEDVKRDDVGSVRRGCDKGVGKALKMQALKPVHQPLGRWAWGAVAHKSGCRKRSSPMRGVGLGPPALALRTLTSTQCQSVLTNRRI